MADKRAIKVETLDRLAEGFQESRGVTDKLSIEQMIEYAAQPVASGENKLPQLVDGTLTEITAEDLEGVTKIKPWAFYEDNLLTKVELPNSITSIEKAAFSDCRQITTLTLPNNLTTLEQRAFQYCVKLTGVILPNSLTTLGDYAFGGCSALTEANLPPNLTTLGSRAFEDCVNLSSAITIPSGITILNTGLFAYNRKLPSVILPQNLTTINGYVFQYCNALIQLTIPATVMSIGSSALQCGTTTNKATFTFLGTTPPTIATSTFDAARINKIIVPAGSGEAYKTATNWANFADFIEEAAE